MLLQMLQFFKWELLGKIVTGAGDWGRVGGRGAGRTGAAGRVGLGHGATGAGGYWGRVLGTEEQTKK